MGQNLGPFGGGMDAVGLNGIRHLIYVPVDVGDHRDMIASGDKGERRIELPDVIRAVIRRQRDAEQNYLTASLEQCGDDGVQIAACVGDGDAAQTVVATEFHEHKHGMQTQDILQTVHAVPGCVATDAGIDDAVVVTMRLQIRLQIVRIGFARSDAIPGRDAVAEAVDHGKRMARTSAEVQGEQGKYQRSRCSSRTSGEHSISLAMKVAGASMIEVRGLKKSIRNGVRTVEILRGVDLIIPKGQFAAIMGASGSGKSTLLGLLAGLDSPSEGEVILDGVSIASLEEDKLAEVRGRRIGFVFQSYQLIPTLTALENVMLPYELNVPGNATPGHKRAGGLGDARRRAEALLETVGLRDRLHHYPVQLSGGEQQRVALARAFVLEPPIVLADEPTGNLDSQNGQHVLDLLTERQRESGTTLVLVTHDAQIAERADRRIHLRDGLIVADDAGHMDGPGRSGKGAFDATSAGEQ